MKQYKHFIVFCLFLALIASGCSSSAETNEDNQEESEQLIRITQEQFDSENIELGELTSHLFEDRVQCNGYIMAPPNGLAQVSTPISGIVESINCTLGDYVSKGEVLSLLSSNELMVIQQDFAETAARLKQITADYERSKTLFSEKIGSEKDFLAIESEYKAMSARYNALKIRLSSLRLDVAKIEDGVLYSVFPIIAPISGYISEINLVMGQYTEQQKSLIEIVDVNKLQLQISVFQDDIDKLKRGQSISFNTLGASSSIHTATLISIGKTINPDSKTVQCIAKITDEGVNTFINLSYIEASVIVNVTEAKSLPNEAILKSGNGNYVFLLDKIENDIYYLRKLKVNIGKVTDDFSEITDEGFKGQVLVKGVYNLQSE